MAERNGLLQAFQEIQRALDSIETLPECDLTPLPPSQSPFPALYLFWDDESLQIEGGDLKWIEPFNARLTLKAWLYLATEKNSDAVIQLIEKVQLVKDVIKETTAVAETWKGNVTHVNAMYGSEPRYWAGAEITILVGEYL